jgi:hypothetical protein
MDAFAMVRATVPEAAVDEHRDLWPSEHNVDAPTRPGNNRAMQTESKTSAVKLASDAQFWLRVSRALLLHPAADPRRPCPAVATALNFASVCCHFVTPL